MDLLKAFSEKYQKAEPPKMEIGDTVRVHLRVVLYFHIIFT